MIQILSIIMLFSEAAYQFAYSLCTASIVISWALAAAFMVQMSTDGAIKRKDIGITTRDVVLAGFAVEFLVIAVVMSGIQQLLLCCIAYIPGIYFYVRARREANATQVLTARERILAVVILGIGVIMLAVTIYGAVTGGSIG